VSQLIIVTPHNSDALQGSQKLLKGKKCWLRGRNHPNCLVLPFKLELVRFAA
jgi:hypothetical protein